NCPGRPQGKFPVYESTFNQWVVAYQYFGGITNWVNPVYTGPSLSPVKMSQTKPHWVLAADATMRNGSSGTWGVFNPGRDTDVLFPGVPPHRTSSAVGTKPAGANEVFVDG